MGKASRSRLIWEENTAALNNGMDTGYTGRELMRMTDCSRHRRKIANREQAKRRKEMGQKE